MSEHVHDETVQPPRAVPSATAPGPEPTGHQGVDDVVASLDQLDDLPVADHVQVFESAHDRFRDALSAGNEPAGTEPAGTEPAGS